MQHSHLPNKAGIKNEYAHTFRAIPAVTIEIGGVRKRPIDHTTVQQLKESILEHEGVLQPVGVKASVGADGGPYRLIFGAHRVQAIKELFEEGRVKSPSLPCLIFTSDTPDLFIELAEVDENLMRKELNASERAAWTTLRIGLLKKSGNVATTKEKNAANGGKGGHAKHGTSSAVASCDTARTKPTVVEAVAKGLNISKSQVHARVKKAAASVGKTGVSAEKDSADTLIAIGRAAIAKAPETHKQRLVVNKTAMSKGRDDRAEARKSQPLAIEVVADVLADLEKKYGEGMIKEAVNKWWKEKHPQGRVPFQTTSK